MSTAIYGNTQSLPDDLHPKHLLPSLSQIMPGGPKEEGELCIMNHEVQEPREHADIISYAPPPIQSHFMYAHESALQIPMGNYSSQDYAPTHHVNSIAQQYMQKDHKHSSLSSRGSNDRSNESLSMESSGSISYTQSSSQQPGPSPNQALHLSSLPVSASMFSSSQVPFISQSHFSSVPPSHTFPMQQAFAPNIPQLVDVGSTERCMCKSNANRIPRPRNAFILFRQKYHQLVLDEGLVVRTNPEVSRELGRRWKALPADEKEYWNNLAEEEKSNHAKKYPGYRYTPRRNGKNKNCIACRHKQMRQQQLQAHNQQLVQMQQQEQYQKFLQQQQALMHLSNSSAQPLQNPALINTGYTQNTGSQYVMSPNQYQQNALMGSGMAVTVPSGAYQYGYANDYANPEKNGQQYSSQMYSSNPMSGSPNIIAAQPPQQLFVHGSDYIPASTKYGGFAYEQGLLMGANSNSTQPQQQLLHSQGLIQQSLLTLQSVAPSQNPQRYSTLPAPIHTNGNYAYEQVNYGPPGVGSSNASSSSLHNLNMQ